MQIELTPKQVEIIQAAVKLYRSKWSGRAGHARSKYATGGNRGNKIAAEFQASADACGDILLSIKQQADSK